MSSNNRTKYIILGILTIKPNSGYGIVQMLKKSTNYFWSESDGQIYPALNCCVNEGLITYLEMSRETCKRSKKIYTITPQGESILNEWLKISPQKTLIRNEFLLKIFFAENMEIKDIVGHIVDFQNKIEDKLQELKKMYGLLVSEKFFSGHLKYWLFSLELGMQISNTEIAWCKQVLKKLKKSPKN